LPYKYLTKNKAHGRIIWDCSWSHDDKLFATASRDKTVKFWIEDLAKDEGANDVNDNWNCVATIKLNEAVTAVDFSPIIVDNGKWQNFVLSLKSSGLKRLEDALFDKPNAGRFAPT
ncbi:8897_t:CDS:2, partial [Entrophospora sp. SA101]